MRDLGDYQTPDGLAERVLAKIAARGVCDVVLEPTCGTGALLAAAWRHGHGAGGLVGVELQDQHADAARKALAGAGVASVRTGSIFDEASLEHIADRLAPHRDARRLIIGNPPWVTSSGLGALGSGNKPVERIQAETGASAVERLTGAGNFDIAEHIMSAVVLRFARPGDLVAFVCKEAAARRHLSCLVERGVAVRGAAVHAIQASDWWPGVAVDACVVLYEVGALGVVRGICEVAYFADFETPSPARAVQLGGGRPVSDAAAYRSVRHLDGACPYVWRQGVKHDCAKVAELVRRADGALVNGFGAVARLDPEHVYPLLKATDLFRGNTAASRKWLLCAQRALGDDVEARLPAGSATLAYLRDHADHFQARKSAIYRKSVRFTYFGLGAYSFAPYKVAISSLHKTPVFRLVEPVGGRPVLLDDTCYFVAFDDREEALAFLEDLRDPDMERLLAAIVFPEAKRAVTKRLLDRLDTGALRPRCPMAA